MSYYHLIKILYSDIKDTDFFLIDTGDGVKLSKWDYPADKPDLSQLQDKAAKAQAVALLQKDINDIKNNMDKYNWYYIRKIRTAQEVPDNIQQDMQNYDKKINGLQEQIQLLINEITT